MSVRPQDVPAGARVDVLQLLEAAAAGEARLTVVDRAGDRRDASFAEVWRQAAAAAVDLRRHAEPGATVGAVLGASIPCVATLVGVLRGGWTLASFPTRARAMGDEQYAEQLRELCELTQAVVLLADPAVAARLDAMPVPVLPYPAVETAAGDADLPHGGRIVQFSSGSTARPKGVVLPLDRVGANVRSVIEAFEPGPGDTMCSWLPLSHDMGLIGALLTGWASGAHLMLLDPQVFVRDPSTWMRACSDTAASHTWAPNFGYALAARTAHRLSGSSLRSLRVCVSGAEPVDAATLRTFTAAMEPFGFSEQALVPGYGLAEATLAVSAVRPATPWRAERVDPLALGHGRWERVAEGGTEIVSVGWPFPGMRTRIDQPSGDVGEVLVAGPSLLEAYVGRDLELVDGAWLRTGDLGAMVDGELFITGRMDDRLSLGGRKLYARDLELAASEHPALRRGSVVAAPTRDGRYVIVAEHRADATDGEMRDAPTWVERELAVRFGASPAEVAIIVPGTLPKTPSGKLARAQTARLYESGRLRRSPSAALP